MRTMLPHKAGSGWAIDCPAKLNLYLDVLGSRTDGFHELETLLVPVRICDQLRWEDTSNLPAKPSLRIRALPHFCSATDEPLTSGEDNLVCRATERLAQAAGLEPRGTFELTKRIPMQAGMGGGSSNAAAALLLANAAWGIDYSRRRLAELAAEVGSDVPFFLSGGAAVCRGRGEIVEAVSGLPRLHFVIVKPPTSLSTAKVFDSWDQQRDAAVIEKRAEKHVGKHAGASGLNSLIEVLRSGALAQSGQWMVNQLESAAGAISPWILRLRQELSKQGLCGSMMTGSGSACFGLARSATQARRIARLLSGRNLGSVVATSSC
jgi:4-diphosphocytidyl-2-C-methyl-D-erythritol kinase